MMVVVREGGRVSGGDGGPNGASAGENYSHIYIYIYISTSKGKMGSGFRLH